MHIAHRATGRSLTAAAVTGLRAVDPAAPALEKAPGSIARVWCITSPITLRSSQDHRVAFDLTTHSFRQRATDQARASRFMLSSGWTPSIALALRTDNCHARHACSHRSNQSSGRLAPLMNPRRSLLPGVRLASSTRMLQEIASQRERVRERCIPEMGSNPLLARKPVMSTRQEPWPQQTL